MPRPSTTPFLTPQSALIASTRATISRALADSGGERLVVRGLRGAGVARRLPWRFTGPPCVNPAAPGKNCTNRTSTLRAPVWRRNPSSDFARCLASWRAIVSHQGLDPARRREAARFVRLDEQLADRTTELPLLVGRQIHCEVVEQTDELTHVGRTRDLALVGEPLLQLGAGRAAGPRSAQEVAQPVRAHADFSRDATQRIARRLPGNPVTQQRDRQSRNARATLHPVSVPDARGSAASARSASRAA